MAYTRFSKLKLLTKIAYPYLSKLENPLEDKEYVAQLSVIWKIDEEGDELVDMAVTFNQLVSLRQQIEEYLKSNPFC